MLDASVQHHWWLPVRAAHTCNLEDRRDNIQRADMRQVKEVRLSHALLDTEIEEEVQTDHVHSCSPMESRAAPAAGAVANPEGGRKPRGGVSQKTSRKTGLKARSTSSVSAAERSCQRRMWRILPESSRCWVGHGCREAKGRGMREPTMLRII